MSDLSRWGSANRGVLMAAAGLSASTSSRLGFWDTRELGSCKSGVLALSK